MKFKNIKLYVNEYYTPRITEEELAGDRINSRGRIQIIGPGIFRYICPEDKWDNGRKELMAFAIKEYKREITKLNSLKNKLKRLMEDL